MIDTSVYATINLVNLIFSSSEHNLSFKFARPLAEFVFIDLFMQIFLVFIYNVFICNGVALNSPNAILFKMAHIHTFVNATNIPKCLQHYWVGLQRLVPVYNLLIMNIDCNAFSVKVTIIFSIILMEYV